MQHRQNFQSLQYLRAVAALMVVAYHVRPRLEHMGWTGFWPDGLSGGVDVFFVISGFIMWVTTCDGDSSPQAFLLRRFLRIAPLYYLVTAMIVLLLLVAPGLVVGGRFDTVHVIASFAFFPSTHPVLDTLEPVLPQGWTLNYEMAFYGLFALALALPKDKRQWVIPLSLVAIVAAGQGSSERSVVGFYTSSIILEFGFGVLIGIALTSGLRLPTTLSSALLIGGLVGFGALCTITPPDVPRVYFGGILAALIVGGAIFLEERIAIPFNTTFRMLGDASYSIYLTHGLVLSAAGLVWSKAGLAEQPGAYALFTPFAIVCAVVAGTIVHLAVERPLNALCRAALRRGTWRPLINAAG